MVYIYNYCTLGGVVFTGGPESERARGGLFLRPPAPLDTGETYGELEISNRETGTGTDTSEDTISIFRDKVSISSTSGALLNDPNMEYIEIKAEILKAALSQVVVAAQYSDIRPELGSIFMRYQVDELKIAATDSFRLAEKTLNRNSYESQVKESFHLLIPLKTVQELLRLLKGEEMVKIFRDEFQVVFKTDFWELMSRLNEGTFPDYETIIPSDFKSEFIVQKSDLQEALKLVSVFGSQMNEMEMRLLENHKAIELTSQDQTLGENHYRLPAKIKSAGLPGLSFNWRYFSDALKALPAEEVYCGLSEDNKPALLKSPQDGTYFYVVMPILK